MVLLGTGDVFAEENVRRLLDGSLAEVEGDFEGALPLRLPQKISQDTLIRLFAADAWVRQTKAKSAAKAKSPSTDGDRLQEDLSLIVEGQDGSEGCGERAREMAMAEAVELAAVAEALATMILVSAALVANYTRWDISPLLSLVVETDISGFDRASVNSFKALMEDNKNVPAESVLKTDDFRARSAQASAQFSALLLSVGRCRESAKSVHRTVKFHVNEGTRLSISEPATAISHVRRACETAIENMVNDHNQLLRLSLAPAAPTAASAEPTPATANHVDSNRADPNAVSAKAVSNLGDEAKTVDPEVKRFQERIFVTDASVADSLEKAFDSLHSLKLLDARGSLAILQRNGGTKAEHLTGVFVVYFRLACALVSAECAEVLSGNLAKILKKKKNVSWSLKMGKGLQEFAATLSCQSLNEAESILSVRGGCENDGVNESLTPLPSIKFCLRECGKWRHCLEPRNLSQRKPKVPKGCADYQGHEMCVREAVFAKIVAIFKLYGAESIDTPVFELKDVLTGKYGEDSKLIYDLKDQGGEQLALRYDLTVPFARFCASNNVSSIKRFHIGKVYRRDQPQLQRGRYREFYQCDVDFAGQFDTMVAEAEILELLTHLLSSLAPIIGEFKIKISHRAVLDGMLQIAGVPVEKLRAITSAVDKLDKETWETVAKEMTQDKGLAGGVAERLRPLVQFQGSIPQVSFSLRDTVTQLMAPAEASPEAEASVEASGEASCEASLEGKEKLERGLEELKVLDSLLSERAKSRVQFTTALARGLDYYTGLIYEAVLVSVSGLPNEDGASSQSLGSIAAGGRYDHLIGMFAGKEIPAVGVSLGVERVFRMLSTHFKLTPNSIEPLNTITNTTESAPVSVPVSASVSLSNCDVYICSEPSKVSENGGKLLRLKSQLAAALRGENIRVDFSYQENTKMQKQMAQVLEKKLPVAIVVADESLSARTCRLKRCLPPASEIELPLDDMPALVAEVKKILVERKDALSSLLFIE